MTDMAKVMKDLIDLAKDIADSEAKSKVIDTTLEIQKEYARNKIQQKEILNYAGANLAYTHAADMSNKLGLNDEQKLGVQPFPASHSIRIEQNTTTPEQSTTPTTPTPTKNKSKLLLAAGITAASLLSGGAGAALSPTILSMLNKKEEVVENVGGEVDLKVEGFNLNDE